MLPEHFATLGSTTINTDWAPDSSGSISNVGGDIYAFDVVFPSTSAGDTLQFKFLNNNNWGACDTHSGMYYCSGMRRNQ